MEAAGVEKLLEVVGVALAGVRAVAGGEGVTEADEERTVIGWLAVECTGGRRRAGRVSGGESGWRA